MNIYKLTFVVKSDNDEDDLGDVCDELVAEIKKNHLHPDEAVACGGVEDITDSAVRENVDLVRLLDN